jgi:acyl transferase domain-containing protein
MMAVGLSEKEAGQYIKLLALSYSMTGIQIGCINSSMNVTITGDADQVDFLKEVLDKASVFVRKLQVKVAYHSSHMHAVAIKYAQSLQDLSQGDCVGLGTMVSSVTGKVVSMAELSRSDYWVENLVSPVLFSNALMQITQRSQTKKGQSNKTGIAVDDLLEIGPHSALRTVTKEILQSVPEGDKVTYSSLLSKYTGGVHTMLQAVGHMHCLGYKVDIGTINRQNEIDLRMCKLLPNLPEYPFDHSQLYWHEDKVASTGYRLRPHGKLDLLGTTAPDWNPLEARWKNSLNISETPWLQDHKVRKLLIFLFFFGSQHHSLFIGQ